MRNCGVTSSMDDVEGPTGGLLFDPHLDSLRYYNALSVSQRISLDPCRNWPPEM